MAKEVLDKEKAYVKEADGIDGINDARSNIENNEPNKTGEAELKNSPIRVLKSVLKGKYFKGVLAVAVAAAALSVLAFCLLGEQSSDAQAADSEETATVQASPVTGESLQFNRSKYTLTVGKTVSASCVYTPPKYGKLKTSPGITYSSNNINVATVDKKGKIKGVSTGTTSITAVADTGAYAVVPVTVKSKKSYTIKDVPLLQQGTRYPSGCESVSSVMLLRYYGYKITVDDFIDDYLPKGYFDLESTTGMTGPDTESVFIGSPYSEDALGCFPPAICTAMNSYLKGKGYRAVDVSGSSTELLLNRYIVNNQPVLIWATMWMQEPAVTYEWKVKGAKSYSSYKDGDTCKWLANEHCMVLVGYDDEYYYLNDPLSEYMVEYDRSVFDTRYAQMGKNAVVLEKL